MIKDVMPFVEGAYGAAVLILGFFGVGAFLRYHAARKRLAQVEAQYGRVRS
jgi:hypothetical protein